MSLAYEDGVKAALDAFSLRKGMPDGPKHLGAERLTHLLRGLTDDAPKPKNLPMTRREKLERPTSWGELAAPDAGAASSQQWSGIDRSPNGVLL